MQVTAGSLTGRFGKTPQYFSEKMLDDGLVHLLATDAHGPRHRAPLLAEGRKAAERWVGSEEAQRLVGERAQAVLDDVPAAEVAPVPLLQIKTRQPRPGWFARLLSSGSRR